MSESEQQYDEDPLSQIQRDKDRTRANLSKILDVAPDTLDDAALADLWCGPTDEAVKERWAKKPWLQPGYVNDINPWLTAAA